MIVHALLPTPELDAAIEQLYVAFQGYPLPASMPPCPCCHSVNSERPLHSWPLRKLRPKDLEEYARDALLTWGGVDEFRHFLPRIFEISAYADMFSFPEPEIIFAKLYHGSWAAWPQLEQEAVQAFLMALWRTALQQPPCEDLPSVPEIESWLCTLAHTGDLSPYLKDWLEMTVASSNATWNLAALIYRTGMPQARPRGIDAFWQDRMDQAAQVSAWLHTEAVRHTLEKAAEIHLNEPFVEELLAAAGLVS
jgi:hypothetical protein